MNCILRRIPRPRALGLLVVGLVVLGGLCLTRGDRLLFHSLIETLSILVAFGIFTAFYAVLFRRLKQSEEQLRALASELTVTEQRERRLAQMLHDHLQQFLVAAKLKTAVLRRRIEDAKNRQTLGQLDELLDQAIGASRSLTVELSPPILDDAGLAAGRQVASLTPADSHPIRVLLADDHDLLREGLVSLLRDQPGMDVVGEACDGEAAVELALEMRPDVVVIDVAMPRLNGIEATRRITAAFPEVCVIGLSMHEQADMAEPMRRAGAVAYVPKDASAEELVAAIRNIALRSIAADPEG